MNAEVGGSTAWPGDMASSRHNGPCSDVTYFNAANDRAMNGANSSGSKRIGASQ